MGSRMKWSHFSLSLLACSLIAFSTASYSANGDKAYWQDKYWYVKFRSAIQSSLHYPTDASGQPVQPVSDLARATVDIDYANGVISDPRIIKSSGRSDLDAAFLAQIVTAKAPAPDGSHADEAHVFELVLDMHTPMQDLETAMCKAIQDKWEWPRDAILAGEIGSTIINFAYLNGKVSDVRLVISGGLTLVDKSYVRAMTEAEMPQPPSWLPARPLLMKAALFDNFGEPGGMCGASEVTLRATVAPTPDDTQEYFSNPFFPDITDLTAAMGLIPLSDMGLSSKSKEIRVWIGFGTTSEVRMIRIHVNSSGSVSGEAFYGYPQTPFGADSETKAYFADLEKHCKFVGSHGDWKSCHLVLSDKTNWQEIYNSLQSLDIWDLPDGSRLPKSDAAIVDEVGMFVELGSKSTYSTYGYVNPGFNIAPEAQKADKIMDIVSNLTEVEVH